MRGSPGRDSPTPTPYRLGLLPTFVAWVRIVADVLFQKLFLLRVGPPDAVGGPVAGRTLIVTGPTSGIGTETAAALARRGAHVVLACRDLVRGERLRAQLAAAAPLPGAPPPRVEVMKLDVSSKASVREFAAAWEARGNPPVHCLINNAGIFDLGGEWGRAGAPSRR